MVLQLPPNIGPGWRTDQIIVTDTVYCSCCRIDVDSGFKAGLKYPLTAGIHQTDFQRLRAGIKSGSELYELEEARRMPYVMSK